LLRLLAKARPDRGNLESLITFVPDRPGHDWRYALNTQKITETLGWRPRVTLEEGLAKTIAWYLARPQWLERVRTGEYRRFLEAQYGGNMA
jgi:dTDP-glucose 4,6-dehydratase